MLGPFGTHPYTWGQPAPLDTWGHVDMHPGHARCIRFPAGGHTPSYPRPPRMARSSGTSQHTREVHGHAQLCAHLEGKRPVLTLAARPLPLLQPRAAATLPPQMGKPRPEGGSTLPGATQQTVTG